MPGKTAQVHEKLGYASPAELILHLPLRYEDETRRLPFAALRPGEVGLIEGVIRHAEVQQRPRKQLIVELVEAPPPPPQGEGNRMPPHGKGPDGDAPGLIQNRPCLLYLRFLHFYPSQLGQLKPGARLRAFGEVRQGFHGLEMVHPRYRLVEPDTPLASALTPVYPTVAGLSQTALRKAIAAALAAADLGETLPQPLLDRLSLPGFEPALRRLHAPPPAADAQALSARRDPAWRRLKFDELLAQQLALRRYAKARQTLSAPPLADAQGLLARLLARLPFQPTAAQRRALAEILADLARPRPMNRLLQGDVGSGKTLVAAGACLAAVGSGHQAAVMAPTEILAEQHYLKFRDWLAPLGLEVVWLAASLKGQAKRAALQSLADGTAQIAVGTHALFQEGVRFKSLALAVVDEQHRFGVAQRLALKEKGAGVSPHLLMLSATPIPRSLAMSYLADLDVSVIDELPPGRSPIATRLIAMPRRAEVIERLRHYCAQGAQAYWVSPLIEESPKLELKAAEDTFAELAAALPELRIGLVHGRLKAEDKAAVMGAFKAGEIDLLVATTVIEVGVDVPNASLMVIDHAERMGLAQLHQLRGRVGRGSRESTCLLLYAEPLSELARQRLKIIRDSQDGFAIAREDLRLRGPGEFLGARQSGLPMLRFADLDGDADLLEAARDAAAILLERHPESVERHLKRWLPRGAEFMLA